MNLADEIKSRVTMQELLRYYGFETDRQGYMCCPFHSEKTASFKAYIGQNGFHCFGCGMHGSVIDFVIKCFNLTFIEAAKKINEDFFLQLPIGEKLDRRKRLEIARQDFERKKALNAKKQQEEKLKETYYNALDEFIRLDNQKRLYKPKSPDEDLHPLFIEALQNYEYLKHCLDCAELELIKHYGKRDNCYT